MEVVMKTKMKIFAMALAAILMGACSSSMQMSRSSSYQGDDLYYNPSSSYSVKTAEESSSKNSPSSLKLADLEKKYQEILANDTIGEIDTVIYKADKYQNPYDRVLSDSYQESYERRLRGRQNPYYRVNN